MIQEQLTELRQEAIHLLEKVESLDELREMKIKYLGKKGALTSVLRKMGSVPKEERPVIGAIANEVREELERQFHEKEEKLEEIKLKEQLQFEDIDVSLPGTLHSTGSSHPLSTIVEEIEDIFIGMGFHVAEGPEVETDQYNFEALNLSKDHPARDMQDSFYITPEILLRTHTSSVQVRTLEKMEGETPVRIICPGKVYRRDDDDATHSHQFTQVEGLVVDRGVSMSELNGVLLTFLEKMFGEGTKIRLRPSYFPFTEPSVEVDIFHQEKGEWMEILGAGMVHPHILKRTGYDPERYTGFAFGMGIERIAMLKYDIHDIRLFYSNDLRFLHQFKSI